eukprot:CAMPEP_0185789918 /NCGR_PEP_ID=MMETSP1174-20130828/153499_1 /TAXON_ID=35687 /ORGANISM="Dictyocha speculum, Strain CCMP1381" /LENGTH=276 /DNA_ID=CAMNT_0028484289 /DNA_START=14 /DNA_END=844 /DNA_ORIENTATION=+
MTCTVFSASQYDNGNNQGAVIQLINTSKTYYGKAKHRCVRVSKSLAYMIHAFTNVDCDGKIYRDHSKDSIFELIIDKRDMLMSSFAKLDPKGTELVTLDQWCRVMKDVSGIALPWKQLASRVIPSNALSGKSKKIGRGKCNVSYIEFLNPDELELQNRQFRDEGTDLINHIYVDRPLLLFIFDFFDVDNNGTIEANELDSSIKKINAQTKENLQLTFDPRHVFSLMDYDDSGEITRNEFLEMYRLTHTYHEKKKVKMAETENHVDEQQFSFGIFCL